MANVYGYARVSTKEQNEDRQIIALKEAGVRLKNIFVDKQSGKDFDRQQYRRMIDRLQENDLLFIKSIDRLGRNYTEIQEQWRILTKEKKVDICIVDMPLLDTRRGKDLLGTLIADLVLSLFSYTAENERVNIRQRQAEGIAAAKARGVKFGKPENSLPENFRKVWLRWKHREISACQAAELTGMPLSTFYYKAKRYGGSINHSVRN